MLQQLPSVHRPNTHVIKYKHHMQLYMAVLISTTLYIKQVNIQTTHLYYSYHTQSVYYAISAHLYMNMHIQWIIRITSRAQFQCVCNSMYMYTVYQSPVCIIP